MNIGLMVRDTNGRLFRVTDKVAYGIMSGNTYAITEIDGVTRDRVVSAQVHVSELAIVVTLDLLDETQDGDA